MRLSAHAPTDKPQARGHWVELSATRAGRPLRMPKSKRLARQGGETRTVKSGTNGSYLVALLLPGLYEVEVAQSSFKTTHLLHVRIAVAETATLNILLEIGAASEQITVQGAAEQLQMESSTLGRVTEGEQTRSLPLVTRNYSQLTLPLPRCGYFAGFVHLSASPEAM